MDAFLSLYDSNILAAFFCGETIVYVEASIKVCLKFFRIDWQGEVYYKKLFALVCSSLLK